MARGRLCEKKVKQRKSGSKHQRHTHRLPSLDTLSKKINSADHRPVYYIRVHLRAAAADCSVDVRGAVHEIGRAHV